MKDCTFMPATNKPKIRSKTQKPKKEESPQKKEATPPKMSEVNI